jgi:hypothetical protein
MRFGLVAIQMLFLAASLHAQDPFAALVGEDSLGPLRAGTTLKAGIPPGGTLSLVPAVSSREDIARAIGALGPTMGAELLRIIHVPGAEMDSPAGVLGLYNTLHAVSTMKGVTYWSVTRGKRQVLFLQSYVVDGTTRQEAQPDRVFTEVPATQEIFTFQEDSSFGKNTYSEQFVAQADHLVVKTENLTAIRFLFVTLIPERGLISQVVIVPSGEDLLFYGLACIRTGMPLGDRESRIQSLENRLIALADWLSGRLGGQALPASGSP